MATNGDAAPSTLAQQDLAALTSVLLDRVQVAASLGMMYGGTRDVYTALGWKKDLDYDDYQAKYDRQDVAGRIVDLPADATWREGFELEDDEDPDKETPFEAAWRQLDKRLKLTHWLHRIDRLAGIGQYAVLYLGVRGQEPRQPLRRAREGALVYVSAFSEKNAFVQALVADQADERFGLPETYDLQVLDGQSIATARGRPGATATRPLTAHWSRVVHVAEAMGESKIYGRPRLQRVYNLLEVLQLVSGATGEGFWRGARPRYHLNLDKDYQGALTDTVVDSDGASVTLREAIGTELENLIHGLQDFIRTSGSDLKQLVPSIVDPSGAVNMVTDLIAAATGIPKRIMMGSERGELASSQDAQEWAHRVDERQKHFAEPSMVRPLVDRLVEYGMMPKPAGGEYRVVWPDITGPTPQAQADLAAQIANAEARHAQAKMVGTALLTDNEFREVLGYEPDPQLDLPPPQVEPPVPAPGAPGQPGQPGVTPPPDQVPPPDAGPAAPDQAQPPDHVGKFKNPAPDVKIVDEKGAKVNFKSDQPRDPKGTDTGGQWTAHGASLKTGEAAGFKIVASVTSDQLREAGITSPTERRKIMARQIKAEEEFLAAHDTTGLSEEQRAAVNDYSQDGYEDINAALRAGDAGEHKQQVSLIDQAIDASAAQQNYIVYRTMTSPRLSKEPGKYLGSYVIDEAFSSTSTDVKVAMRYVNANSHDVLAEIRIPKNAKALSIRSISAFSVEDEVLLPRNQRLRLIGAESVDGRNRLILEAILDEAPATQAGWDESQHPRHPAGDEHGGEFESDESGPATTGPWNATQEDVETAIQAHMDKAALKPYYYGLRVDEHDVKIGDELPDSRRWENGDLTGDTLAGTSALEVSIDHPDQLSRALKSAEKYYGKTLSLIVAEKSPEPGEDAGEVLLSQPTVLKVWRHLKPAKVAAAPEVAGADLRDNASFSRIVAAVNAATDAILRSATYQRVQAALVDLGNRVVARFGQPGQEFDPATQAAVEFMRSYGAERVQGIGDTTRELLRQTLTEGLRAGETDRQMAARVRLFYRQASKGRARVIAATEAHNATSHGMFVGMLQAGVTAKVWRTQLDVKVRTEHQDLEGQVRHIGDPFQLPTGEETMRPGGFGIARLDVGCRCFMQPASNLPGNLRAASYDPEQPRSQAADPEWPARLAVHEQRVLAGVRQAFREQQAAVIAALNEAPSSGS